MLPKCGHYDLSILGYDAEEFDKLAVLGHPPMMCLQLIKVVLGNLDLYLFDILCVQFQVASQFFSEIVCITVLFGFLLHFTQLEHVHDPLLFVIFSPV